MKEFTPQIVQAKSNYSRLAEEARQYRLAQQASSTMTASKNQLQDRMLHVLGRFRMNRDQPSFEFDVVSTDGCIVSAQCDCVAIGR